jgi:hypothetical protein
VSVAATRRRFSLPYFLMAACSLVDSP